MTAGRRACIVGIGETEYRRWGAIQDRTEFQLAYVRQFRKLHIGNTGTFAGHSLAHLPNSFVTQSMKTRTRGESCRLCG